MQLKLYQRFFHCSGTLNRLSTFFQTGSWYLGTFSAKGFNSEMMGGVLVDERPKRLVFPWLVFPWLKIFLTF